MSVLPKVVTALSGTQYAPDADDYKLGVPLHRSSLVTWIIDHPAATTTAYSVQVSNMTDQECRDGSDDWDDYTLIATQTPTGAEKVFIEFVSNGFARVRLKMVTTVGSGSNTVRCNKESP